MIKKTVILFALFWFIFLQIKASDTPTKLEIKVSSIVIISERGVLEYTINAECERLKFLEDITDFEILAGPAVARHMTKDLKGIHNTTTFRYIIGPHKEGPCRIPGASVEVNGNTYSCDGVEIDVLPAPSIDDVKPDTDTIPFVFIRQEISSKKVFEGDPVKVTYKLYSANEITQVYDMKSSTIDGCWIEEEYIDEEITLTPEKYNNIGYYTAVLKEYIIYPLNTGNLIIDKVVSLDIEYKKPTGRKIKALWGDGSVLEAYRDTIYTYADTIQVVPLRDNSFLQNIKWGISQSEKKEKSAKEMLKGKSDIVLAVDYSSSMLAEDLKPNRSEATRNAINVFRDKLDEERTGLVIFAGKSYPWATCIKAMASVPDYNELTKDSLYVDGTAIGIGLMSSINLMDLSQDSPKTIILISDGTNNLGNISPLTAADIARQKGINIFVIGIGAVEAAPFPVRSPRGTTYVDMELSMDEDTLKKIASMTGGKYFRAINNKSFNDAVDEIIHLLPEAKKPDTKNYEYITPENAERVIKVLKDI